MPKTYGLDLDNDIRTNGEEEERQFKCYLRNVKTKQKKNKKFEMCLFLFETPKRKKTFTNSLEDETRAKHTNSLEEIKNQKKSRSVSSWEIF